MIDIFRFVASDTDKIYQSLKQLYIQKSHFIHSAYSSLCHCLTCSCSVVRTLVFWPRGPGSIHCSYYSHAAYIYHIKGHPYITSSLFWGLLTPIPPSVIHHHFPFLKTSLCNLLVIMSLFSTHICLIYCKGKCHQRKYFCMSPLPPPVNYVINGWSLSNSIGRGLNYQDHKEP